MALITFLLAAQRPSLPICAFLIGFHIVETVTLVQYYLSCWKNNVWILKIQTLDTSESEPFLGVLGLFVGVIKLETKFKINTLICSVKNLSFSFPSYKYI